MIVHRRELFTQPPSCILLDLDNTLYEYAPCNAAGMAAAQRVAQSNLNIAPDDFERHFTDARKEVKARLGPTASSHNRLLYFQRTLERAGFAAEVCTALQMAKAFWAAYLDAIILFDSVTEFLDDLRIAGIPILIVTDLTAEIQYRKLVVLGLDGAIDGIVTSEESGQDKPAATGFQMAMAKVSDVARGSIWMIGDDAECDLVGAKEAIGATTLHKMHDHVKPPKRPDCVDATFYSFAELRKLLSGLR